MYKDKVDERIIGYLKEDSRESFVDIGKKLKLSESAVRRRVKNLVDSKTIDKFTIELGEENVTSAIVLVSVDSATETSKVSLKLAKLNGVKVVDKKKDKVLFLRKDNEGWLWSENGNERNDGKYVGILNKNGLPSEGGTFSWSNGNKYEGEWKEGERHGQEIGRASVGKECRSRWSPYH